MNVLKPEDLFAAVRQIAPRKHNWTKILANCGVERLGRLNSADVTIDSARGQHTVASTDAVPTELLGIGPGYRRRDK